MAKESRKTLVSKSELSKLHVAAEEKEKYLDSLQRMKAEFDNYRKRTQKEKEQLKQFFLEDFILELLPVMDNLERALMVVDEHKEKDSFITGIAMVHKQFMDFLQSKGVSRIESIEHEFDPYLHEAVLHEQSDTFPEGIIINEVLAGYMIGDKVLRHSKVIVSSGQPE